MISATGYYEELKKYVKETRELFLAFDGSTLLVTGAAGLIGTYLVDLLIVAARELGVRVRVYAYDRNRVLLEERFPAEYNDVVVLYPNDICQDELPELPVDYIIHAASNTSPYDYANKPVDTMLTNILGTNLLCDYAVRHHVRRFLFCSSVEAYGRNNGDVEDFKEEYSGYVDSNTLRANYPASKRCSEALCNAYAAENPDFEFVIARIGRYYGPTVLRDDNKAPTQLIRNAVNGESIVLKSDGLQLFSWGYVGDCAMALLTLLIKGERGNAYNVADSKSRKMLKEFAAIAASVGNGRLEFVEQSAVEKTGYSKITKATLDCTKIEQLGWSSKYHLEAGIPATVNYLKQIWR